MRCIISVFRLGNAKTRGSHHLRPRAHGYARLVTETKVLHELPVPLEVRPLHVVQEAAPLSDHLVQALEAVMILLVRAEMLLLQVFDPFRKNGNLNGGRSSVGLVGPVFLQRRRLRESHDCV